MTISVPFNDTSRIFAAHAAPIEQALYAACASGRWLLGAETKKFAEAFAAYNGVKHCLPVANGTDALELALRSVLLAAEAEGKEGPHEIITVANAGGYTTTACRLVGAVPVYADIEPESQLISLPSLRVSLSPATRAVVLTHLYGGAIDVPAVRAMLAEAGHGHVVIIEDCAQAHGAKVGGKHVGAMGDLAAFSFYPTKNLGAFGDAGAIVTNHTERYEMLGRLHQYGWGRKYEIEVPYARNSRMDEVQAAILNILLPQLDGWNEARRRIYARYAEAGAGQLQFLKTETDYVGHLAIVQTNERDAFLAFMKERNIAVDVHYPTLDAEQPAWKKLPQRIGCKKNLENSRAAVQRIATLPCFPTMREEEIAAVCTALSAWGQRKEAA